MPMMLYTLMAEFFTFMLVTSTLITPLVGFGETDSRISELMFSMLMLDTVTALHAESTQPFGLVAFRHTSKTPLCVKVCCGLMVFSLADPSSKLHW